MPYITSVERLGLQEGQRAMLRRILQARFGTVSKALEQRIAGADQASLDRLADRLATAASPDDLLSDD